MPNHPRFLSLLSFRAFISGSREDDISVMPANIQYISTSDRCHSVDGKKYRPTTIHLMTCSIEVAQSREAIDELLRYRTPKEEYIQDISQLSEA